MFVFLYFYIQMHIKNNRRLIICTILVYSLFLYHLNKIESIDIYAEVLIKGYYFDKFMNMANHF